MATRAYVSGGRMHTRHWLTQAFTGRAGRRPVSALLAAASLLGSMAYSVSSGLAPSHVQAAASYASTVLGDSPLAYWRFGDSSGTTATDSSGNGRNATYSSSLVSLGAAGAINDGDTAISVASGTTVPVSYSGAGLPVGNAARTVEAWVKHDPTSTYTQDFFSYGTENAPPSNEAFGMELVFGGTLEAYTSSNAAATWPVTLDDSNWHQVVIVYDGNGSMTAYVDGASQGTQSVGQISTVLSPKGLQIGQQLDGTGNWVGGLDDYSVYSTALTASQVAQHYLASGAVAPPRGGPITTAEVPTGDNFCWICYAKRTVHGERSEPVNTATGVFFEDYTDLSIPGRGLPIAFTRSYSAYLAAHASSSGPLGFGWTDGYAMSLSADASGNATITGPDGGQTVFALSGTTYTAASRAESTLVKNGDGTYTFTQNRRTTYTFDAQGHLTAEKDLNGYVTSLGYNGSGQLSTITDPAGRALTLGYTGANLTSIADPAGRTVTYGYNDGAGNLTDVTDANGGHWHYGYGANHLVTSITDPRGGMVTNHYDASNRVDWQTDALTRKTSFQYTGDPLSAAGGSTTTTDPKGNAVVDQYMDGERIAITYGAGTAQAATWQYRYDPGNLGPTLVVDPKGNVTSYAYDAQGNRVLTTDPLGRTRAATYDSLNDLLTSTDGLGVTTTRQYDTAGNLTTTSTPLVGSSPAQTQVTIDGYGDPAHPGDVTSVTDPDGKVTQLGYDQYGDLASVTDPVGDVTTTFYNTLGWPTSRVSPRGNVSGCNCAAQYTTTYDYTDLRTGRLNGFGDVGTITDPLGHITKKTYDADRNLTQVVDGAGNVTTTIYDAANEATSVTRGVGTPAAVTTKTDYWPDGTVEDQVDGKNNTTSYGYDPLAELTSVTTPATASCPSPCSVGYAYDAAGNRTTVTDQQGQVTTYGYDAANQLTSISYSDGVTPNVSSIVYDADGQRKSMTDATGTSTWSYDSLHRLTSSSNGAGATVLYGYTYGSGPTYDLKNQVRTITYPSGDVVSRGYDDAGHMTGVTDWLGHTTTFAPDPDSNVASEAYPNHITATMSYDHADGLTGITDTLGGSTVASFGYSRDANEQVQTASAAGVPSPTQDSYGYTPLNQLASDGNTVQRRYGYDAADNPVHLDGTAQSFDAADEVQAATTISLVGTNHGGAAAPLSTTQPPVSLPGGVAPGDLILVASTQPTGINPTAPGYTSIDNVPSSTGGGHTVILTKVAAAGDSSVSLTYTALSPRAIVLLVYRGVDTSSLVFGSGGATTVPGTSVTAPSVNTTTMGERVVLFQGANGNANSGATWTPTSPDMAEQVQESGFKLVSAGAADEVFPTAGATGNQASTLSQSANLDAVLLPLKPAGTTTFAYDARGNRVSVTVPGRGTTTLAYDQANRLTSYGTAATYAYNGDGLRMSKTVGGTTEQFTYDLVDGLPLPIVDGSTEFVYGPGGQPLEQVTAQTSISLVRTSHNSVGSLAASIPLTLPAGIQAGDQIIATVTYPAGVGNTLSTPNGYAQVASTVTGGGAAPAKTVVYRRTAGSGDTAGSTVTVSFGSTQHFAAAGVLAVYRGVDPNNAIDWGALTSAGSSSATSASVSAGPPTTVFPNDRMVVIQGGTYVGTVPSGGWSVTGPTGQPGSVQQEDQDTATATVTAGLADQALGTPGLLGTAYTSTAPTSGSLTTMLVPLKTLPAVLYIHQDQLGSTRMLTDQAGTSVGSFTFDAYGALLASGGTASTPLLYAGQYRDAESALYYLRARFYDPATAQMLTRDPRATLTGEPHSYVGDDPLNGKDPSGFDAHWCDEGAPCSNPNSSGTAYPQAPLMSCATAMSDDPQSDIAETCQAVATCTSMDDCTNAINAYKQEVATYVRLAKEFDCKDNPDLHNDFVHDLDLLHSYVDLVNVKGQQLNQATAIHNADNCQKAWMIGGVVIGVGSLGVAAGPAAVGVAGGAGTGVVGSKQC